MKLEEGISIKQGPHLYKGEIPDKKVNPELKAMIDRVNKRALERKKRIEQEQEKSEETNSPIVEDQPVVEKPKKK